MADRTVMLRIGANISGLQSQLKAAQASVQDFSKKSVSYVEKNSASITDLSGKVGVVGAGLTALAATAVTRFAQFDKAMSGVAATGDDARGSLDALRAAAITAGADTAFSAQEAAGAIEQLAKAGVSSADILGGGLKGALSLAAAGEIEVGAAAEIAASAMTQFSLKGTDVGHVADLLAAGAGKAQGGVADMGAALNQSGLIAAQVGLSIEETTGSLAAMASAGLIGSDAGTSLKTSLIALSSPSATAAKEMERLGISAYDAQGNFIGMEALAGQLQSQLGGLTDEQRNSALATIFGSDALRTANVLYKEGASGIAEWTAAVDEQGYAAETAAQQTDNLIGDLERLGGSMDSVLIQSGSGANDALRSLVQSAEGVVDAFGRIPAPVLTATTMIAGGGGLALLGVAGLSKLAVATVETRTAMMDLGIMSEKTAGKVGKIGKAAGAFGAVAAAGGLAVVAMNALTDSSARAAVGVEQTVSALRGVADTNVDTLFKGISGDVDGLAQGLQLLAGDSFNSGMERFGSGLNTIFFGGQLQDQVATTATQFENLGQALAGMVAAGDAKAAAEQFDIIARAAEEQGISIEEVNGLMPAYAEALAAAENAQEGTAAATEGATDATAEYTDALQENIDAQREAAGVVLSLRDAQSAAEAAFDDARASIKENGETLDVTTEKGRANRSALDDIAESGWEVVDSMRANGASQKDLQGTMETTRERFIKAAQAAGATKAEARALADELRLIPKDIKTDISADGSQAKREGKETKDYLNSLTAQIQVAADTGNAYAEARAIQSYINGLNATITVYDRHVSSGAPGSRQGGITRAGGGSVTGPGTATSDSIPAMLSNGEHVWTAAEVQAVGGQEAMYRMRAAAQSGLLRFAGGGAVGQAARQVSSLRDRLRSARRHHASDAAIERLERQLEEANARLDRVREEAASLRTDLRRGNIRDSVSGGLSGALGVTDELRDLAGSGDLSRRGSRRLSRVAGSAERSLTSLYKQAERIDKRIESATSNFEKWKGIADGVSSSISGAFSLGGVSGGVDPWSGQEKQATGSTLLAASQAYQAKARNLVLKLRELQAAGYGTAILQEVAGQGVDGGVAMADALLQLSPADAKALQASQAAIGFYAGRAGVAATDDQVTSAARALEAAEAQGRMIDGRIGRWSRILGSEMARALGIRARASGGPTMAGSAYLVGEQGPELHVPSRSGYVVNAAKTANLGMSGPSYTFNITNIHPVNEPASVTTNRALATAASTGRF